MKLLIYITVIIAGTLVIIKSISFPKLNTDYPGPGFFPMILGTLFIVFGFIGAVQEIREKTWSRFPRASVSGYGVLKILLIIGAVVFYIAVSAYIGFTLTVTLLLIGLMIFLGVRPVRSLVLGIMLALTIYLLFYVMLRVPLPDGIIEHALKL